MLKMIAKNSHICSKDATSSFFDFSILWW